MDLKRPPEIKMRYKRETLQDMTRPLKHWLYKNKNNPYPTKGQKVQLAEESKMTLTQVSNWFANARRRLKNTVRGNELTWETRVSMYNDCVKGNQEAMDVESDDSAWESGEDDGKDSPMAENRPHSNQGQPPANQPTNQPTLQQPSQPTLPKTCPPIPNPMVTGPDTTEKPPTTQAESISRHIEKAIQKELMSLKEGEEEKKPVVPTPIHESLADVKQPEVKCEPEPFVKQEPVNDGHEPGLLPSAFPVSSSALSQKEQQLLSSNVSAVQHLNPTLASRLAEPVKTENLPFVPPVTTETMAANITNQIAAYLMATSNMSTYPMMPFGYGPFPFLTPQMQEELRQHTMLMQAHAEEMRKKQQAAGDQLQDSTQQPSAVVNNSNISSPTNTTPSHLLNSSLPSSSFSDTYSRTHPSPQQNDITRTDTHELAPSPANSDDLAYPKSETPKYKNTLLQRYLQGDRTLYSEQPPQQQEHSVTMVTPLSSPSHQHPSFSPLDLRKRVRNLSGSMGSQEYEDISECETDAASNGIMSPHLVAPRDYDVTHYPSVFDELAKRWQEVNRGTEPTKDEEEKDDLMLKEVSAIFTLANLATSRTKATQQS